VAVVLATTMALSVAGVVQAERAARVDALFGADMESDCVSCRARSKSFGECRHGTMPVTNCVTDQCYQNLYYWVECDPKPPSGKGDCKTHVDANAPLLARTIYRPAAPLNCGSPTETTGGLHDAPSTTLPPYPPPPTHSLP